ncbi:MAG: phosphoribosylformylglycinamidine synthase subunit PurS [Candidatus Aminicenantia bacterium]
MKRKFRVLVMFKDGVLEPQGLTVMQVLKTMGYKDIQEVRQGKFFDITVEDGEDIEHKITEIGRKVLANPIIERFEIVELK